MHTPIDHLAKKIGKRTLDASGATFIQHEISHDAQYADLLREINLGRGQKPAQ
jgi:hypothetical protein